MDKQVFWKYFQKKNDCRLVRIGYRNTFFLEPTEYRYYVDENVFL